MIDEIRISIKNIKKNLDKDNKSGLNHQELSKKYLSKDSDLSKLFILLPKLSPDEKKEAGKLINQAKKDIEEMISSNLPDNKSSNITKHIPQETDITLPGNRQKFGKLHPLTIVEREMNSIFKQMGFSVYAGPHIELDSNVFEKLNLPKNHPARSLQDTLVIEDPEILLRSHTSSVEIRAMEGESLPIRVVVPGRAYRYEDLSSNNHISFTQYEGLAVGKGITLANLHGLFNLFAKNFYGESTEVRIRAKYYPQVEPGCGLDLKCRFCGGEGCQVCKYRGWVELSGGGMVHPNVLRACKIDPAEYTGIAWGMGFDRIVMQKYGINDIRSLFDGSLY